MQRQAGVDDVLDEDDVAGLDVVVEVLQHPHLPGRGGPLPVAGDRHEVHRDAVAHRAHEIRHEHEAALEDRDEMNPFAPGIITFDLGGQRANPLMNVGFGNQYGRCGHVSYLTAARTFSANMLASAITCRRSRVSTLRSRISTFPLTIVVRTSSP